MESNKQLVGALVADGYLKTPEIISAFYAIDRADFVLPEYKNEAYGNYPLPIGSNQTISQPLTVVFMLELLEPREGEKILDIGAGSGWVSALLSFIIRNKQLTDSNNRGQVSAIERVPELCAFAKKNLEKYGFISGGAAEFYCRDATAEIPNGQYDKIIASAAAERGIPDAWREKLKIGGRIVAPISGSIWLFVKKSETEWEEREFPGFAFVPLVEGAGNNELWTKNNGTDAWNNEARARNKCADTRNKDLGIRNKELIAARQELKNKKQKLPKYFRLFFAFCFLLFVFGAIFAYQIYLPHSDFRGSRTVVVESGAGPVEIAELLKNKGVIGSKWSFVVYARIKGFARFKPGRYLWSGAAAIPELARDLRKGGTNEVSITIPEGWSAEEIANYFLRKNIAQKNGFLRLAGAGGAADFRKDFRFLEDAPKSAGLEGYLFPDTYRVFKDASAGGIIRKMLANFGRKLSPDMRSEISRRGITVFDAVRMASLIEKEVVSDEDRAIVSGILWKRLRVGIPLQVDATIVYAKNQETESKKQGNGKITIEDTKIDSPYNTYRYYGMPPGPIANPGISAIRAAIFPEESPYFYYLSSPDGKTVFSKTLKEHNAAKRKYLTK